MPPSEPHRSAPDASGEAAGQAAPTTSAEAAANEETRLRLEEMPATLLNLPNLLSLFRILLVPLLVVALLTKFEGKEFVGLGVFWLASLTDLLDGFIARRWKMETRLGKLLDPAADKILTGAAFISLVELGVAPAWMVVVIVARELAVSTLRSFAAAERVVIAASWGGKVKTLVQVVTISLLIFYEQLGEFAHLAPLSLWITLIVTVASGIEYYVRFGRMVWAARRAAATGPDA